MTVTDEELMAYVDGELDAARVESLRQELATNAELARRVAAQQALRDRLHHAFDRALSEPVPSRLNDVAARGRGIELASAARQRPSRAAWLGGLALAAGILLGVGVRPAFLKFAGEQPYIVSSGTDVTAGGALADALSHRLASEQTASDPIRLGVSFLSKGGEYCRTFTSRSSDGALAGMACRHGAEWRIDALQSGSGVAAQSGGFRQASTSLPPLIIKAAESSMAGEALDAAAEAQARDHNWRSPAATG